MGADALTGPQEPPSLPSGEGQGVVRRDSAVQGQSAHSAERPWGRPDATATIAKARALRKRMTRHEVQVWIRLRALREQGFHFRRQVPIGRFVVDFACLKGGLVVEIDGGQHSVDTHRRSDQARDAALADAGFRALRFWNAEVDADVDGVIETVLAHLKLTRPLRGLPHPYPSPEGEGGAHF